MPSSHVYADLSAGFVRFRVSDGTHTHVQRIHVGFATVDNVSSHGSPTDFSSLIIPEADVNDTARNYMAAWRQLASTAYTMSVQDFQPVSGGVPSGPPVSLLSHSVSGTRSDTGIPEAELSLTFRDVQGAPMRFTIFGSTDIWLPNQKPPLVTSYTGGNPDVFAAFILGLPEAGTPGIPAGLTHIVSHHGQPAGTALARVSGLNNRLRRAYRVK